MTDWCAPAIGFKAVYCTQHIIRNVVGHFGQAEGTHKTALQHLAKALTHARFEERLGYLESCDKGTYACHRRVLPCAHGL